MTGSHGDTNLLEVLLEQLVLRCLHTSTHMYNIHVYIGICQLS